MNERPDTHMETCNKKSPRSKSSSQLFVPRASVIRHTEEFKPHNDASVSKLFSFEPNYRFTSRTHLRDEYVHKHDEKKEEKDSGIDESFDDEEEKNNSDESITSGYYDSDQSLSTEMALPEEKMDTLTSSDSSQPTHEPQNFPHADDHMKHSTDKINPRCVDNRYSDKPIDSARPLMKDPHLAYMLQLYRQADDEFSREAFNKSNRHSSIPGHAKKRFKTYPKEHNAENKSNLRNSLVDFSILSLRESKCHPGNHSLPSHEQMNNPSFIIPGNFTYGYENTPRESNNNGVVDMKGTYMADIHSAHIFNRRNTSQVAQYESNLQCEYCHKKFNNEEAAKRHLLTHKGKRTHKCTHCSRSFYEQSSFLRHLKSHSGEKAHKCEQCSMAFSKRSALEVHIRTHTGERPFVCKYCGKGFSISGNLHRHVLIHTGHRPYKCGKCPRAFNNPSHLARHISSFHA